MILELLERFNELLDDEKRAFNNLGIIINNLMEGNPIKFKSIKDYQNSFAEINLEMKSINTQLIELLKDLFGGDVKEG